MAFFVTHIGSSGLTANHVNLPLPAGAQEGDLAVLVVNARSSHTMADPRLPASRIFSATRAVYWGYLDGSQDDIDVTMEGSGVLSGDSAMMVGIYRTVRVEEVVYTAAPSVPYQSTVPVIPNTGAAILACAGRAGTTAGGFENNSVPGWTQRGHFRQSKQSVANYSWLTPDADRHSTPASVMSPSGTNPSITAVVLRIEDASPYVQPPTAYIYDGAADLLKPLNASEVISTV